MGRLIMVAVVQHHHQALKKLIMYLGYSRKQVYLHADWNCMLRVSSFVDINVSCIFFTRK